MKVLSDYEINLSTLAIVPIFGDLCRIYDGNDIVVVKNKSTIIVNRSCHFFGSSLPDRQQTTKRLIQVATKAPIIVEESKTIIFFPTNSPRDSSCIWISYNNLDSYDKENTKRTRITFKNGVKISIPVSYNIVDNQFARCLKLEKEINKRRKSL